MGPTPQMLLNTARICVASSLEKGIENKNRTNSEEIKNHIHWKQINSVKETKYFSTSFAAVRFHWCNCQTNHCVPQSALPVVRISSIFFDIRGPIPVTPLRSSMVVMWRSACFRRVIALSYAFTYVGYAHTSIHIHTPIHTHAHTQVGTHNPQSKESAKGQL